MKRLIEVFNKVLIIPGPSESGGTRVRWAFGTALFLSMAGLLFWGLGNLVYPLYVGFMVCELEGICATLLVPLFFLGFVRYIDNNRTVAYVVALANIFIVFFLLLGITHIRAVFHRRAIVIAWLVIRLGLIAVAGWIGNQIFARLGIVLTG